MSGVCSRRGTQDFSWQNVDYQAEGRYRGVSQWIRTVKQVESVDKLTEETSKDPQSAPDAGRRSFGSPQEFRAVHVSAWNGSRPTERGALTEMETDSATGGRSGWGAMIDARGRDILFEAAW